MRKSDYPRVHVCVIALLALSVLVCIVAASPDSTLRFIDPTPANYTQEQDFTWGVLAINTHKSIYLPNEAAFIGIAVLDNEGHMVCDADVTLTITDPSNKETVLSTGNGLIKVSPQCCVYGVTNLPDYYTNYTVDGAGTYVMNLTVTAVTADGTKSITDEFTVQNSVDFDVARDGATRIYPSVPYVMNFTIKANKDYDGLIREYVPASFVITPQDGLIVTTVGDTKILTWTKNLVEGETYNIYYEFDAPDVSPYLFTLGALEIGSFKEDRQWQIANDDTVTYYFDDYDHVKEKWVHHPGYMVDGNTGTYAYCDKDLGTQLLTSNSCTGTDLGTISKVEIRAYGYMEVAGDNVSLRPVFTAGDGDDHPNAITATNETWGPYIDITNDTNASSPWTWSNVSNLDCDVVCHHAGHKFSYCAKVEINVTYADTIGPTVTIINPKNKTYNTRSLTLDASIGADAQSCWYSLNGGTNASFTCGTTVDITANEGSNNISVYANDTLGNVGSDIVLFSVDTSIILDIRITSPANGTITNDPTPTLTLLAIDKDYPTINYTLYIYNEDGTLYSVGNSGTLNNDTSTDIVLSPAINLIGDSTTYIIRATANDSASNSANSSDLYITLEPPWLDLIFPGYGYWDNDGNIPFTFKYGSPSYPRANCTLYINSIYNQHDDNTKVNTETTFDVTGLAEGKNQNWTINCTMNGASWISVEDTSIFHVDTTVPTITIDEPTTSSPVYRKGGEQFWVNFTYTELYPMFYTVEVGNSSDVINTTTVNYPAGGINQVANVSFNLSSIAADGWYNVSVHMHDKALNCKIEYENNSVVKGVYTATISQPANQTTDPNVNATYELKITNTGNFSDTFTLAVVQIDSVDVAALNKTTISNLDVGGSQNVTLNVTDADAGKYNVTVNVTSTGSGSEVANTSYIMTTVRGPTLELANVTNITQDWGINFNLNHSVSVTHANASNVNVTYNVSWIENCTLGTVNRTETKWCNQTRSNSTVQNVTVEVNATTTNASATNDTETFWINITKRDIVIVADPETPQTVDPDETFWINGSAKDEYDDELIGEADLLREGISVEIKDIANGNANFSRTEPLAGTFNFSIRFYNLTHYNNATTLNSTVTVRGPTLELANVTNITQDWGINFNLNHSVSVTNANASNVNVTYNVSWIENCTLGTVNRDETEWCNQTRSNSTVQNVTVEVNANSTNASAVNDSETFWINITAREVNATMISPAAQTVNVSENFSVNASAVDEYGENFTGNASLIREGTEIDNLTGITKYANFTTNVSTSGTYNFSVRFFNATHYHENTTSNTTVTVYGPRLEIGNVSGIEKDWGRSFYVNQSVTARNATAKNVTLNYSFWLENASWASIAEDGTEWKNQSVSNNTVANNSITVWANATDANNATDTFWINITAREVNATMISPAAQTVNVSENFSVNASAVDEYGENFTGNASLIREGTEIDNLTGITKYANFTTNVSTSGTYNFSVRFFNATHYHENTTSNTTVTVYGPRLEIGNVSGIEKDWGRSFYVNQSVTARNATAKNVTLNYSFWLENASWASIAEDGTEWKNQSVSNNTVANNSITVWANATDANNATDTFWINITAREVNATMISPAAQTVNVSENFSVNASAVDEYGENFTGNASLIREGTEIDNLTGITKYANFTANVSTSGTYNFSVRFFNATHYHENTTSNTTVTVYGPRLEIGNVSGIEKDWGRSFYVNQSVTARNATAKNVTLNYSFWLENASWASIAEDGTEWKNQSVSNNTVANNSITAWANATDANNATKTFWINITAREVNATMISPAAQTVNVSENFSVNASAVDEYGENFTGNASLIREGTEIDNLTGITKYANFTANVSTSGTYNFSVRFFNATHYHENTTSNTTVTVYGPRLEIGNVSGIEKDWGRSFYVNQSVTARNATAKNVTLNYSFWLENASWASIAEDGTEWKNQSVSNNTVANNSITVWANATDANNATDTFWINITAREVNATMISPAAQTVNVSENFSVNASAVDEYGENFTGNASLIREGTEIDNLTGITKYANFTANVSTSGTYNFSIRFYNLTHYNNATTSNASVTVVIPVNITSFAPPSPVNDTVCNWRTFNVTVNQTVNVSWYLNNTLQHTNVSTKEANYSLHAEVVGEHNVSAIASNANGTDMQSWVWNVTAAPLPVLEINKTDNPDPVSPGGTLNYSISVNNTGNATATNVTVMETYDENVTFVAAVPAPSSGDDTWIFPTLNASETRWINISVLVNASVPNGTVLHNIVNVSCAEGVTDTDTENTTVFVAPVSVLEITKTDAPDPVSPGGTLNYTISVNNTGNATATNVTVMETYDKNVTFVTSVPAPSSGDDTWQFQTLNVSETRWINISVTVNASVPNGTVLHNIVNVTCDEGVSDTDTENTTVFVAPVPVLEITKTDAPDPVSPGGTLNYTIHVNNTGNATATNVTVIETYDKNVTFVSAVPAPLPGNDTWKFTSLNVSETRWINISVSVNASVPNGTVLHNVVNVSCDEGVTDTDTENTTVFAAPVLNCICGDICVNETGWWRDGGVFNPSSTPIQDAIDNATAGDTICVKDGTYNENVVVTKSDLTICSANGPSVTTVSASLNPDEHVFKITDQTSVTLEGFEIRDATGMTQSVAGIYMDNASDCNISDNVVTNISATGRHNADGIRLSSSSNNNLTGNNANSNTNHGIYLYSSSNNNTLTGNNASNNTNGIRLDSSSNNNLTGNNASNNTNHGIWLYSSCNNNTLTGNNANSNNKNGIRLHSSCNNNLTGNNASYNNNGIRLISLSNNNTLTGNNASNNKYGIYLSSSSNNTFTGNNASNNNNGIRLDSSCNNNLTGNNANSNTNHGIWLYSSCNNNLTGNNANSNTNNGIRLESSSNHNTLTGNNASDNNNGIRLISSSNNNTLTGNNASNNTYGIYLVSSSNNNLTDNNANSNNNNGIRLDSLSNNNTLSDNNANSNTNIGIHLHSSCNNNTLTSNNANSNTNHGIYLDSSCNNNTLTDNNANSNTNIGIRLNSSSNNNLTGNNASDNNYGIRLISSSNNNTLTSNNASDNTYGIYLDSSSNNNLTGNNASYNTNGIRLISSSNNNTLTDNNANSNTNNGIRLVSSSNNTLTDNNASYNTNGIGLYSSSNNWIYNNYFNNTNNAYDDRNNVWNITKEAGTNIIGGPYLGGNYWSDYRGKDLDGDGLGDTLLPYNSSGNIQTGGDWHPLTTVGYAPPEIISFAPPSPVNDTVCNWRTFNVTVNQTVNVSWYLNNTLQHTNVSTKEANYSLHAEVVGEHNVSAIASNANGTDMQSWVWNVTAAPLPVLEINKTDNPDPVSPGGTLNYTISVNNTGNATATNVTVMETYDKNVTFVTSVPAPSSGDDTWQFQTLNVSETRWINISVTVNASVPNGTVLHNIVNVTCDEGVSDTDTENTTVFVAPVPVLEITKTDAPDPVSPGGALNYSIHVNNTGNATATNVTVIETYDKNVTFVSAVPAPSSGDDTWVFATLNVSEMRWINVSVTVNASVLNGTVLHNIVNVTCDEGVSDTDTEDTTVLSAVAPVLEINKTCVPDPVSPGGTLNYSIAVNNTGNATATNVTVIETYDKNVTFVSAVPAPSSGDDTWQFPTLNVSEMRWINVSVTVNASVLNGTVLHNIVNVTCDEGVSDTDTEDTTVLSAVAPVLEIGNVSGIEKDWGRSFYVNQSVTARNATAKNVTLNYSYWLDNASWASIAEDGTEWKNQSVSNNTVANNSITVWANATDANNATDTFWLNITARDITATMNSPAAQTVNVSEDFYVNASAVDEYGEDFVGDADLIREGTVVDKKAGITKYANFSTNVSTSGTYNFSVLFYNTSYYINDTSGNSTVTVSGPVLEIGNVSGIEKDWGRSFYVNQSVTARNATAKNVTLNYSYWLDNASWASIAEDGTEWKNQSVSNNTVANNSITVWANATDANNATETFWLNITARDITATMNSPAAQTVNVSEDFYVNASAVDEYGEDFVGDADLIREGTVVDKKAGITKYANFSTNVSTSGTYNFSVLFYNTSYYINDTSANSTVTVSGPVLEIGNVSDITKDWGRSFWVNHSVKARNATANNVTLNYSYWLENASWASIAEDGTEWKNQSVSNNTVANNSITVWANATDANNATETFWLNITARDITATRLSPATQSVNVSEDFYVNASAVDEYEEDFVGDADLIREGTVVDKKAGITKYANFSTNVSTSGTYNFSVLFYNTSYYINDTSANSTVTVSGPVLEIGNVSDITKDWGRSFWVNHSVKARNATANNVTLNYSYWLENASWASIAEDGTEWKNQSVSNNTVANNSITVWANATDANNATETFWLNITARDITATRLSPATQSVNVSEDFYVNASAVDEYEEDFVGDADLIREGTVVDKKAGITKYANFSTNVSTSGTYNFSVLFYNTSYYINDTSANSTVTVSGPVLEIGNVSDITKDWGINFYVNQSVTVTNANASNVNVTYNVSWISNCTLGTVNRTETKWCNQTRSNSTVQNVTVEVNATTTNASATNDTETFWINITKRDIVIVANPEATQTVDPDVTFWINGSAKDEYDDELIGEADLLREELIVASQDIANGNANFSRTEPLAGTFNFSIRFYNLTHYNNATTSNASVTVVIPVNITSFAPPSPVNDTVCNWRRFNVTVNQTVNVSWYLNNTLRHTNVSTKEASYTVHAEVVGEHNVSAIASNENGTDMQTWIWNVSAAPLPVLEINKTGVPDPVSPGGTLNYTIHVNNTGNATATNVTVKEMYDGNVTFVTAVPAPSSGDDTWQFPTLNVSETRWVNISVTVNASVPNGTVLHNVVNVSCDEGVTDTDTENTTVFAAPVLNCTCGDICVNETGWWRDGGVFNPSSTPIQDAIDNATAGDTICVKDGTYNENVDVGKRVTIHSENGSANCIVQAANSGDHVFNITANYVNITGFTVVGATGATGVRLESANHCNIFDNNVSDNEHGIYLHSSCSNEITDNNVSYNTVNGVELGTFTPNNYNTISNNIIAHNGQYGIYIHYYEEHNTIFSNTISNNTRGIFIENANNNNIIDNVIVNNQQYGIALSSSINNLIDNNYFNSTNNAWDNGNNIWNTTKTLGTNIIGGPYLGGNYWSDYSGKDLDGDGLGDTLLPYNSSGNIQTGGDWHPLTTVGYAPPEITSFAPPSPVNDTVCNWRTFNVTVNQTVNVSWYLNNTLQHTNVSTKEAKYTLHAEVVGEHNVSPIASNANGTDMQTWVWNVTAAPVPVLEINKTDNPDPVSPGGILNYSIRVNNTGNANATNVTVTETYDENVTFVAAVPAPSSSNDTWQFQTLNVSETRWINVSVTVNVSVPNGTVLHNIVNVSCEEGVSDTDTENTTVFVAPVPVLEITKTDAPDPVSPGGTLNYSIAVNNTGNATATNVTVIETYDKNVSFVAAVPAPSPGNDTWQFATLNVSEMRWINISVIVNASVLNGTVLHNIVNVTCEEGVSDFDTEDTTVLSALAPVLEINKTCVPDPVPAGGTLNYSISVNNTGNATATNVTVKETYDENVTFVTAVPVPSQGNDTWKFTSLNVSETRWINISVIVNASVLNGTVLHNVVNVTCDEGVMDFDTEDTTVLSAVAPVLEINKTGVPDPVSPGGTLNYSISVNNTGNATATNVTVKETYDGNVTFVTAVPAPSQGNDTWQFATLNASETRWINISVIVNASAPNGTVLHNIVNVTCDEGVMDSDTEDTTVLSALAPVLEINKTGVPDPVSPGGTLNYTISVNNAGNATATNVTVKETYDGNVTFVSAVPAPSQGNDTWVFATLNVSETRWINISVTVNASVLNGTVLHNIVNVTCDEGVSDSDTEDVTTLAPSISVNKTANPTAGAPSTNVNFTINVTNTGDCTLDPVKVVDTLPTGMSYVAAGTSPLPSSVVGNTITWNNVGPLNVGASTTITLIAHIDSGASGTLTELVNVTGTPAAGDNVTDSDTADVTTRAPSISVTKTASPTAGAPSTNVNFTINVTNTGDCTLNPVEVVDTLPAGMSYVAAGTSPAPSSVVGNTITWNNVGPLNVGASTTITLIAHIDSGASGTLTDLVNVTGTPAAGDNVTDSDTADVEVLAPSISVKKAASPTAGAPCTDVTFTINVTNTGDCILDPVKVVDTLPTRMSYVAAGTAPAPSSVVGNTITWNNVGPLNSAASTTITLIAHIDFGASGTLTDLVNATGTPPAGDKVTDSDTATVVVRPKPTPPIPPITRPQQAQYFTEDLSVQGVGEIFYEKTILASGVGVREYMWGDTGNGTFAMTIHEVLDEGVRLNCSGNCSDMGKITDPIYGDDESPVMTNFECKKMVQFEIGAKDNPLIYGLEGEAIYSNPGFSGGMNAQVKEHYAVSSLQKDETAKMTTTASFDGTTRDWTGCNPAKPYNANELNFDTKNAFTGSWGTDSSWKKGCSKDIKHHQYFDGTFQVDKNLMFQEEVTKPCPEKEPHGDC